MFGTQMALKYIPPDLWGWFCVKLNIFNTVFDGVPMYAFSNITEICF